MMSALIVAAFLSGSQPPTQQTPQQPTRMPPTVPAPKTPPAPQPATTRPPAEQLPAPTPTPTAAPTVPATLNPVNTDPDRRTALALLDRIDKLVGQALQESSDKKSKNGTAGTSGSLEGKSGRVTVDRATLDEILAEVAQVKMMLQR